MTTTGLKGYHPEMGEEKPAAQIEAHLSHYGKHWFLKSQIELKGRGILYKGRLQASDLAPHAQDKAGWYEYQVTEKALDTICQNHAVAYEMLL